MFFEKVIKSVIVSGFVGILAVIGSLSDGKPFFESLSVIPVCIIFGTPVVLWFVRDKGGDYMPSSDTQIQDLQYKLKRALQSEAEFASRGNQADAIYWRSQAAVIESQLRNLGA